MNELRNSITLHPGNFAGFFSVHLWPQITWAGTLLAFVIWITLPFLTGPAAARQPLPRPKPAPELRPVMLDNGEIVALSPVPKPRPGIGETSNSPVNAAEQSTANSVEREPADVSDTTTEDPLAVASLSSDQVVLRTLEIVNPPKPKPAALFQMGRPPFGFDPANELGAALDAVSENNYALASKRASNLDNPLEQKIVEWAIARAPNNPMRYTEIEEIRLGAPDWPDQDVLRLRAEQALLRTSPPVARVLAFFSDQRPITYAGSFALARAWQARGEKERGDREISKLWREGKLSGKSAVRLHEYYGKSLTRADHRHRLAQLLYDKKFAAARRQAARLGGGYPKLAEAVIIAMSRKRTNAARALAKVPKALRSNPLYQFAQIRSMRRNKKEISAAKLMIKAPRNPLALVDPDRWWLERQDLSRQVLDKGRPDLAYEIAAGHSAQSGRERALAEFHAGWYALRFLEKPDLALPHFERLADIATIPRTISRAHYWLARTHAALGDEQLARLNAEAAADHGQTYYGQLARDLLGLTTTGVEEVPQPTAADRLNFQNRELVRAAERLAAAGHPRRARSFLVHIAKTVNEPGELALAATFAKRIGQPRVMLEISKTASRRGLPVGGLANPLIVIPANIPIPKSIDRALVYAIAQQESAFNVGAKSWAGARGLMQMMPGTAKATARSAGRSYSLARLTTDAKYNATLGAHHLGQLIRNLRGSYILTFAGYNAGQGRAERWVRKYGDPRGGRVDPIDWVERIPFDETRDYVQRVMANLQGYRSRLGHPLAINQDLMQGRPVR